MDTLRRPASCRRSVEQHFPIARDARGIFGHSMGGHGALVLALRNPGRYRSVSAFAPDRGAVAGAVGAEGVRRATWATTARAWAEYDACALSRARRCPARCSSTQGTADKFLDHAAQARAVRGRVRRTRASRWSCARHDGYDHGYYFVATFVDDHLAHHAAALAA